MSTSEHPSTSTDRGGRLIDARLHLLDRQILDCDGVPVATVDDIELSGIESDGGGTSSAPRIEVILTGSTFMTRIFGGRLPRSHLHRITWDDVAEIGITLRLRVRSESLDATWPERWVRDQIISRIPGGRHAPD
ncbi:hypothetical protein Z045_18480 [Rhodococcus pyridinivorans KG-16]|uniref:PRC-barrel domain-containing protein n=1 Tax=Rhodococcus pyridinivorans KG-16 TaxID=1441730 RepID=A0A0V9UHI4_9NOCA|nr:hypothetical protein [Rhodococcus pyridinivorans]KSZ57453.1 hypothetical protein Z045_18480 [Rhodococcus pyridinivorans KG-16]